LLKLSNESAKNGGRDEMQKLLWPPIRQSFVIAFTMLWTHPVKGVA